MPVVRIRDAKCLTSAAKILSSSDLHSFSSLLRRLQRHTGDPHRQLDRIDRDVILIAVSFGKFNSALFQTPVPQRQPTGFPPQGFDAILLSIHEQEQRSVGDVVAQCGRDNSRQPIEAFSEINRLGAKIDVRPGGQSVYDRSPPERPDPSSVGTSTRIRTPPGSSMVVLASGGATGRWCDGQVFRVISRNLDAVLCRSRQTQRNKADLRLSWPR